MKMFKAIFMANAKEYTRDKASMFWMLVFPLILIFIFGWMYSSTGVLSFDISFLVHEESMMFLSGVFFPYEFMPDFLQPIIRVLPLTYLGDALRQVMLGFTGARTLQANIMVLLLFLVVTSLLTVKFWRWE